MKRILAACLLLPLTCSADWFGPKSYEDCIIDGMKGTTSNAAAAEIKKACRTKFPLPAPVPAVLTEPELKDLASSSLLEKVERFNPEYNYIIRLHNNTDKRIDGVKITVVAGNGALLTYKQSAFIEPYSKGNVYLTLDNERLDSSRKIEWRYEEIYASTPL